MRASGYKLEKCQAQVDALKQCCKEVGPQLSAGCARQQPESPPQTALLAVPDVSSAVRHPGSQARTWAGCAPGCSPAGAPDSAAPCAQVDGQSVHCAFVDKAEKQK